MKLTKKTKKAIGGLIGLVLAIGCAKYGIGLSEYKQQRRKSKYRRFRNI